MKLLSIKVLNTTPNVSKQRSMISWLIHTNDDII